MNSLSQDSSLQVVVVVVVVVVFTHHSIVVELAIKACRLAVVDYRIS